MSAEDFLYYDKNYTELMGCEAAEEDLNYRAERFKDNTPLLYGALKIRAIEYRKRAHQAEVNLEYLIHKLKVNS